MSNKGKLFFVRGLEQDYLRSWNDNRFTNALYVSDTDGTQVKKLFSLPDKTLGRIAISPDHAHIAIEAFQYGVESSDAKPSDLYLYDLVNR